MPRITQSQSFKDLEFFSHKKDKRKLIILKHKARQAEQLSEYELIALGEQNIEKN